MCLVDTQIGVASGEGLFLYCTFLPLTAVSKFTATVATDVKHFTAVVPVWFFLPIISKCQTRQTKSLKSIEFTLLLCKRLHRHSEIYFDHFYLFCL